jgi:hypothetical protein
MRVHYLVQAGVLGLDPELELGWWLFECTVVPRTAQYSCTY